MNESTQQRNKNRMEEDLHAHWDTVQHSLHSSESEEKE